MGSRYPGSRWSGTCSAKSPFGGERDASETASGDWNPDGAAGRGLLLGLSPGCTDAFIESLTDRSVNELVDAIDDVLDAECACLAGDNGDTGVDDLCNESIRLVFKATLARCLQAILNDHPEAEATYECVTSAHAAQASCLDVPLCDADRLETCEAALESALDACPPLPEYRNCILGI